LSDFVAFEFFLWGYVRGELYVTPWATTPPEVSGRVRAAKIEVAVGLLNNLSAEIEKE
jgi:hypothetical protein